MTKKIRIRISYRLPKENKNDYIVESVERFMAHVGCSEGSVYNYRLPKAPGKSTTTTIPMSFHQRAKAFADFHGRDFTELVNEALKWDRKEES